MTLDELKESDFVVGLKETERAVEKKTAVHVFIASDCDERISAPLEKLFESWSKNEFIDPSEWKNIHFIRSFSELLPLLP